MYNNMKYSPQSFHRYIASRITDFIFDPGPRKLMLMTPPQHGKTELVSRNTPAFAHGNFPDMKIIGASYSSALASSTSRDIQRIISSPEYNEIFPMITLGRGNDQGYEIANQQKSYKAVGILGGLTGHGVDLGIIDDPIKDNMEAQSKLYRDRHWEWYLKVFLTRLHNRSKQLICMTRWHQDDLCGRILQEEGDEWEVIIYRAIKEDDPFPYDQREIGEALWNDRHSLEKFLNMQRMSLTTFNGLYQQRPKALEGNIFKRRWFRTFDMSEVQGLPVHFAVDSAYTAKTQNDPSAIMAYCIKDNCVYIINVKVVWLGFPDLCRELINQVHLYGSNRSIVWVEPKASGISIIQELRSKTHLNITEDMNPESDKVARANVIAPAVEAGRVLVLENAPWLENYFEELETFPQSTHDDRVDVTVQAVNKVIRQFNSAYTGGVIL